MLTIDIIIVGLMAIFFIIGYKKGFIVSLFTFLGFFVAIIGSMSLTQLLVEKLKITSNAEYGVYIAYFLTFIAIFTMFFFAGRLLEKIFKIVHLNFLNRIAGALFGTFKVIFLVSLIFWLSSQVTFIDTKQLKKSLFYNVFMPVAPTVIDFTTNHLSIANGLIEKIEKSFEKESEKSKTNKLLTV